MNEEKFKLWRLALATIHADGKVTPEEVEWFNKKIEELSNNHALHFSKEQVNDLRNVLHTPVADFYEEFKDLHKPADKALLVHYLNIISNLDGDFAPAEREQLQKLTEACMSGVQMDDIQKSLAKVSDNIEHHQIEKSKGLPSFFKFLVNYFSQ